MPIHRVTTRTPEETRRVAASLRPLLKPGCVVALHGELGSGKTCFVSGLAESLRCREPVGSPTFTLMNEYAGDVMLYHADAYRLDDAADFLRAGLAEYFDREGVLVVEWAERIAPLLPDHTLHVRLYVSGAEGERAIEIEEPDR
jgi:tRNA threonylcarbamoyladenosine biosynthesis protein TsaE